MSVEEKGVVLEERGERALVRVVPTAQCTGCASAGVCHGGQGGGERVVEADNPLRARTGDEVVLAVASGALLKASALVYLLPVVGIVAGAGISQLLVTATAGESAGGTAAGLGGGAGGIVAVMAARALQKRGGLARSLRPRISRFTSAAGPGSGPVQV